MTISVSKAASYAVLTSDYGQKTVSASKLTSYVVLTSDYGLNTVSTSKVNFYAVLTSDYAFKTVTTSKLNAYAIISPANVSTSKLVSYAVIDPTAAPHQVKISKANTYAVLIDTIGVAKFTAYAVLQDQIGIPKLNSYAVLTFRVRARASKLNTYVVLNGYDDSFVDDPLQPPTHAVTVNPSDTDELPHVTKAIYVGSAGDVQVTTYGYETVVFHNMQPGWYPIKIRQIWSSNTHASNIIAAW